MRHSKIDICAPFSTEFDNYSLVLRPQTGIVNSRSPLSSLGLSINAHTDAVKCTSEPWSKQLQWLGQRLFAATEIVLHYLCVMKSHRLRNVTITLEEHVARWARLEAARRDTSVSRLLAGILKDHMREKNGYENAMRRALARKPFLKTDGRYLSREEVHDRAGLR